MVVDLLFHNHSFQPVGFNHVDAHVADPKSEDKVTRYSRSLDFFLRRMILRSFCTVRFMLKLIDDGFVHSRIDADSWSAHASGYQAKQGEKTLPMCYNPTFSIGKYSKNPRACYIVQLLRCHCISSQNLLCAFKLWAGFFLTHFWRIHWFTIW